MLKQGQNLSPFRKRWYNSQTVPKPANSPKKILQYSNRAKTCHHSEKDVKYSTRAKACQKSKKMVQFSNRTNLSPVRKRWYNTQTGPKPFTSQKKMVQYSNRDKICHQSEKDGRILKQCQKLPPVRNGRYNSQTKQPANSQKKETRSQTCHKSKNTAKT